jgi:tRNA G18 (ribose-2'-O)-methylase SpoU
MPLRDFIFEPGDVVFLGNEYDGLPSTMIGSADATLYVPLPPGYLPKKRSHSPIDPERPVPVVQNGIPNLNVAMAATIICYEMYTQRMNTMNA